jgi:hypothetical protein
MSRDFKKINLISLDVFTTNITNIDNDLIAREIDEFSSADLIFLTNHCNLIENSYAISTKTGMLVLFNSYIHHMTNRHYGEEKRIVVSANFKPKNENMTAVPDWSEHSINGPSAIKVR